MKSCAIAIFVKTPGLSPLKTRLAASIGRESAETFFKLSTEMLLAKVNDLSSQNSNITPFWAVAEKEAIDHVQWSTLPTIWQETGDLGGRLNTIYSKLKATFDCVLLIGADSPQIPLETFKEATNYLLVSDSSTLPPRFVIGPAFDGGFYLFGGNSTLPSFFWNDIPYSTVLAGSEIYSRATSLGSVLRLNEELDVDTIEDLQILKTHFQKIEGSTTLPQWLTNLSLPIAINSSEAI